MEGDQYLNLSLGKTLDPIYIDLAWSPSRLVGECDFVNNNTWHDLLPGGHGDQPLSIKL